MRNVRVHKLPPWEQLTTRQLPRKYHLFLDHVYDEWRKYSVYPKKSELATNVYPGIWIGGEAAARSGEFLQEHGIRRVLNMAEEIEYEPIPGTFLAVVGIDDGRVVQATAFVKAAAEIDIAKRASEPILVHCAAGISRSCCAVLSYLMEYESIGFWDGLDLIRQSRPWVSPHPYLVRSMVRDFSDRFLIY